MEFCEICNSPTPANRMSKSYKKRCKTCVAEMIRKKRKDKQNIFRLTEEQIKELAVTFFFDWYNSPGTNSYQGFDEWWAKNKDKYLTIKN